MPRINTTTFTTGEQAVLDPKEVDSATAMGLTPMDDEQKKLRALIERRHPEYKKSLNHWQFLEATYEGGREWFETNVFRYIKEGDKEYSDRQARAYRFNHTKEVVDLLNKYLFKQAITRNLDDAPESVKAFWLRATRNGLGIQDLARQVASRSSRSGRIAVVVDNPATAAPATKAEEKALGVQTYAYLVGPDQLLDYSYDDAGGLNWALLQEAARDDADPLTSTGEITPRFRLWTKTEWRLFELQGKGKKQKVVEIGNGAHDLGEVPVILADHVITDELYVAPSMIDDIAYLDRAVANYLSNLDAIIQDQTFSQLAMPAQGLMPGEDNYTKLLEMGTKRVFLYDGEGGEPKYISPDPKQAQMILAVIHKIINEIYHTCGLAGERTKQDNSLGIDNSSGVAKAYDFERVNALLAAKADSLQVIENKIARLVALWNGETVPVGSEALVTYPDNFDTRGLYDEFDIAARLMLIEAPDSLRQEQMKAIIDKLFPQLGKDLKSKMLADLKDWPPIDPLLDPANTTAQATKKASDKNVASASLKTVSEG